jgi:N utilization substance protein A
VAVYSHDDKVDPVGACVGLRGARVKNIVRELNNEKVDIIRWTDDINEFVTEALKPAQVRSITLDEGASVVHVTVDEEDLSKAIGRRGQNARLTSKLVGWDVQVKKDESQHEQFEARVEDAAVQLGQSLGLDVELSDRLFRAGGVSAEMVTQMPAEYIASALEVAAAQAESVLEKAQAIVLAASAPAAEVEAPAAEVEAPAAEVEAPAEVEAAPAEDNATSEATEEKTTEA